MNIKKAVVFLLMTVLLFFNASVCKAESTPPPTTAASHTSTNKPAPTRTPAPTRAAEPNVRFSRAFSTQYAEKGDEITLSYTVRNEGTVTVSNIVIQDELVGEVERIERLPAGERRTVSTRITLKETSTSTPTLSYEYNGKSYSKRLSAGEIKQVNVQLRVELEADKENVAPGELVTLRLKVVNEGDVNLYSLRAVEPMLGELGNIVSILPPGGEHLLTRTVPMKGDATFRFSVSGSSDTGAEFEVMSNEKSIFVTPIAAQIRLELKVKADKMVLDAPQEVTFSLDVDNQCSLELRNVLLSEQTRGEIRNLAFVPTGKMPTITQSYMVDASGIYRFMAQVSDSVGDRMTVYSDPIYITVNNHAEEVQQSAEITPTETVHIRETHIPLLNGQPYRMQEDTATFEKLMMGTVFVLLLTLGIWYVVARIRAEKKRWRRRRRRKNNKRERK